MAGSLGYKKVPGAGIRGFISVMRASSPIADVH